MMVFVATMEQRKRILRKYPNLKIDYGLCSMKFLTPDSWREIYRHINTILVDSGAHSFQHIGEDVADLNQFIDRYRTFIKGNTHSPHVLGFFELDIDNKIGLDAVEEIRKDLCKVSDKIIPVWHMNRGIDKYYEMLEQFRGRRVAVSGFADEIYPEQYNLFINSAHKYNCNIHLLGCTKFGLLKELNLNKNDSVDSSSWLQAACHGSLIVPSSRYTTTGIKEFTSRCDWNTLAEINLLTMYYIQNNWKEFDNV